MHCRRRQQQLHFPPSLTGGRLRLPRKFFERYGGASRSETLSYGRSVERERERERERGRERERERESQPSPPSFGCWREIRSPRLRAPRRTNRKRPKEGPTATFLFHRAISCNPRASERRLLQFRRPRLTFDDDDDESWSSSLFLALYASAREAEFYLCFSFLAFLFIEGARWPILFWATETEKNKRQPRICYPPHRPPHFERSRSERRSWTSLWKYSRSFEFFCKVRAVYGWVWGI